LLEERYAIEYHNLTLKLHSTADSRGLDLMYTKLLFTAALLFSLPLFASAQKSNYIGYRHKGVIYGETLPNGVKDLGGGLLSDENYAVSRFTKGKKFMLWLEMIISRDKSGVPSWEVKDVLKFDELKKNQEFLFSYSSPCTVSGKTKLDLIVRAELTAKKEYKVLQAWTANVKKEKFETISIKRIECKYVSP
jgi:hypothetical protein